MTTETETVSDILRETETVSDILREAGAESVVEPTPVDATALAVRASIEKVGGALTEFDKVADGLADLRRRYANVAFPVATKTGMADAIAARSTIRAPRYSVERLRKDAKAPVLALGRNIDERASYIANELLKLEEPIDEQIKAEERRIAEEKEAKRLAEENRVKAHQRRIDEIKQAAIDAAGTDVEHMDAAIRALVALKIDSAWEEFEAAARNAQTDTLDKLRQMRAAQAQRDAEAAELARLRKADEERQRTEAAALAESRRVEAERLKAEAKALADARASQEAEFAAKQAEFDRKFAEQKAQMEEMDRREQAMRAEERRKEEARRAEQEAILQAQRDFQAKAEQERALSMRQADQDVAAERAKAEAAQREKIERMQRAAELMLEALLSVRRWSVGNPNLMPNQICSIVQGAIEQASPEHVVVDVLPVTKPVGRKLPRKSEFKQLEDTQIGHEEDGHHD